MVELHYNGDHVSVLNKTVLPRSFQKQSLRKFICKSFIKEVLPGSLEKTKGEAGEGRKEG